ncbi:MAG: serine/threonine protein kinase [Planctomycetes bacterium]|nr:serine/threonine protein kinase [Planctomycetota bacterium]
MNSNGELDGAAHDDASDRVELLLAQCLELPHDEQHAQFERTCAEDPALEPELRRRWSVLVALGLLEPEERELAPEFPDSLGEFELIRRLGGGGMGVVFLARQPSLGRQVALKLIRREQLYFPRARERFRREAEAVARLSHPGIVPVYVVGEERGLPYFAMEFVHGLTLADVLSCVAGRAPEALSGSDLRAALQTRLKDTPITGDLFERSWVDACVSLALQTAEALTHAHAHGVLHRDVKPSNVMLTPAGRARLLDFGLTALAGVDGRTRTGSQLGTLHYMSPEQVRAQGEVDERSDVYALGVMLYELLTLQLPFGGEHAVDVQSRILDGAPQSPRELNRRVSSEAATVCAVAMERDPARRYASMAALRADLGRLLDREPIRARPPSALLRILRAAQRRPARAVALSAAFLLVVVTPSALYLQGLAHQSELREALRLETEARRDADLQSELAERAHAEADRQRQSAEEAAATANGSLDFVFDLFRRSTPEFQVGETTTAIELLEHGAQRVERELLDVPRARARIQSGLGQVFAELGRYGTARPLLEGALESYARIGDEASAHDLTAVRGYLGMAYVRLEEFERAEALLTAELETARAAAASAPNDLVYALNHMASLHASLGRWSDARAATEELLEFLETHDVPERTENTAINLVVLAQLDAAEGKLDDAGSRLERALGLQRRHLPSTHPELFDALGVLGFVRKKQGLLAPAREAYVEADCIARHSRLDSGSEYANMLYNWSMLETELGEFDRALALLERAARIDAEVTGTLGAIGRMCLYGRGRVALAAGRWSDALRELQNASEAFEGLELEDARWNHGGILQKQATCWRKLGQPRPALDALTRSVEVLSGVPGATFDLAQSLVTSAELHEELGAWPEAELALERACETLEAAPQLAARAPALRARLDALRTRRAEAGR